MSLYNWLIGADGNFEIEFVPPEWTWERMWQNPALELESATIILRQFDFWSDSSSTSGHYNLGYPKY